MAVSEQKQRRMTTIPKELDKLIVSDAERNNISISEQIALVLQLHYQQKAAIEDFPQPSPSK